MFRKPLRDVTIEDVQEFVKDRHEREGHHLEYKAKIDNTDKEKAKRELLKDITGMANAGGGLLIIGITENDEGFPEDICGTDASVGTQKVDEWINNVLLGNVDERLYYDCHVVQMADNRVVVILDIPASPKKPHMVPFQEL